MRSSRHFWCIDFSLPFIEAEIFRVYYSIYEELSFSETFRLEDSN